MTGLPQTYSAAAALQCSRCGNTFPVTGMHGFSSCCQQPLLVRYEDAPMLDRDDLPFRERSMWRYFEMLPVMERSNIVSLGEGLTPVLPMQGLASKFGFADLRMKDESANPTGSFKARGISAAVSKAKELGIEHCIVPTAGNAGGALAAYCATAGMHCTVVMPSHTPKVFKEECECYGAELILVDGLINDCAKKVASLTAVHRHYYDVSTLKEPYRLEGKKTMGYEIAEHGHWQLPDVILYPTGGGTGLIGIWKAFIEMKSMGWISGPLPKMVAVQSKQCAPVVKAFHDPLGWRNNYEAHPSLANGLAVPYPFGMDLMQQVLKESEGTAIAVSEADLLNATKLIARTEGLLVAPEGGAIFAGLLQLREQGWLSSADSILMLNTGSGYKYMENF